MLKCDIVSDSISDLTRETFLFKTVLTVQSRQKVPYTEIIFALLTA